MMHITEPLPTNKRARLVFGIDWRAYPVKGGRAERRRYTDAFNASHFVEFKVGAELIGGFAEPDMSEIKGARLYSGAARVAMHERIKNRAAALVLLQDDSRVYLVFVVRGAVRSDEVVKPEMAHARRLEIEQECQKNNLLLVTLGSGDRIGDVDEPFQASDLLANRKVGLLRRPPISLPTAIPVMVIVAGAFFGVPRVVDMLSPPPPPPRAPTFAEQYAAAVHDVFARTQPRASELAPALLASIGRKEMVIKGWLFQEANCPSAGFCTMTFRRNGGNFDDFDRAATADMRPLGFARDGRTLASRGPAIPKAASLMEAESRSWPDEQAFIDMLQTPPQRMSVLPLDLRAYAAEGKQAIVFAENPGVLNLIARELDVSKIDTVLFHGGVPIAKRVKAKDQRFLTGLATGLLSTKESGRAGYNLPNADYVLFYDRSWTWRAEYQAMRRALRWNRKGRLSVEYFHLPGSIDVYQDQMVAHKRDAMQAGLDWATPELEDEAFLHMDTLLDAFVEDIARLHGEKTYDMRKLLKEAA